MKDFIQRGLEEIKKEKIKPIASWKFQVRDFFWWIAFSFSILAGGISISISIFLITELDWGMYQHLGHSFLETFLIMFPHFWFVFLSIFLFISYQNLRHTKKGYHYELILVTVVIVFVSIILSLLFSFTKIDQKLNQIFINKIPGYERIIHTKEHQWSQPEEGLFSGRIIKKEIKNNTTTLILENAKSGVWEIFVKKETLIRGRVKLVEGEQIKIIGKQRNNQNEFEAKEIRPWERRGNHKIKF